MFGGGEGYVSGQGCRGPKSHCEALKLRPGLRHTAAVPKQGREEVSGSPVASTKEIQNKVLGSQASPVKLKEHWLEIPKDLLYDVYLCCFLVCVFGKSLNNFELQFLNI